MYQVTNKRSDLNVRQDDMLASRRFVIERKPDSMYFYELEEAVVLDVILDDLHPEIRGSELDPDDWPKNIDGSSPLAGGPDYSWIGRIKFRFLYSDRGQAKEGLRWASPIENTGVIEYPLMNEVVIVGKYLNKYYYSRKLNSKCIINSNATFVTERVAGHEKQNINIYSVDGNYSGPISIMNATGGANYTGILGNYFKFNHHIRMLKHYEGDTILESRFGSSIRFSAYDEIRGNDNGLGEYSDGGGNPMMLIRNRQAPIKNPEGYTGKGYTLEDINKDGSSIQVTSGKTISKFVSVVEKPMISGITVIGLPSLDGDQIVISSDRLVFSSKANEMLFFSKKRIGMATDSELHLDSLEKMTLTSMKSVTVNAPQIYLGDHGKPYEPALLGRTTITWMYALCDWMLLSVNTQIQTLTTIIAFASTHTHLGNMGRPTSPPLPITTAPQLVLWAEQLQSLQASQLTLIALRSQLSSLMSSRVFLSGGED